MSEAAGNLRKWARVAAVGLVVATVGVPPAAAGPRYRFAFEGGRDGTIWADGARCRIEVEVTQGDVPLYDLVLDDGDRRTYVNADDKTYWDGSESRMGLPRPESQSMPFAVRGAGARTTVLEPSVEVSEQDYSDPVAGLPTRNFVVRFRYVLEYEYTSEVAKATVSAVWLLWTTASLEGRPCGVDPGHLATGIPEVDALLGPKLAEIPGFPVKRQLSVTHRFHRGKAATGIQTLTLDQFEPVTAPASLFAVPAGYRHQAPVFGALAVEERVMPGQENPP